MKNNTLANELELWGIERDYCLFTDGSIGFGFDVTPIDVSSFSDEGINQFAESLKNFINSLPPGTDVQFVQDIEAGNNEVIRTYEGLNENHDNIISNELTKAKIEKFEKMDVAGILPFHSLKVFMRKPFESALIKPSLFISKKKSLKITEERLVSEIQTIERLKNDFLQQFETLGLEARSLSGKQILNLAYKQWNPERELSLGNYNPENVRDDLLFTDVYIDELGFDLSTTHHKVISLKTLPENTYASMARLLRHLPFNSRTFLSIHIPDQTKEIESLQSQRRVAFSMAMGKTTGVSDLESQSKLQDLEQLLEETMSSNEKVFHVSLNILLRSINEDDLNDQVSQTLSLIRELSGSEGLVETIASFDIFKQMSVPNARSTERSRRLKSSNLSDLIPIYAPWRGHKKPSLMLRSSSGSLLSFDPFDSSHSNANQLISAGSGAGKSFFCNLFILQTLKEKSKVFFVDIGGSYRKLCENLDGQYIPLGVDCGISINPFDLPDGETEPTHHKIKFLVGLVELMTKEENSIGLPKL
ncbi:MAG: TraC family protein, partial [Bdellovibrionales bacterium]|nr:TraC family protein [Bdellovibrionales bacterium]NQZ20151.1 TraC family protein [Bdellovibrionales bacterium]